MSGWPSNVYAHLHTICCSDRTGSLAQRRHSTSPHSQPPPSRCACVIGHVGRPSVHVSLPAPSTFAIRGVCTVPTRYQLRIARQATSLSATIVQAYERMHAVRPLPTHSPEVISNLSPSAQDDADVNDYEAQEGKCTCRRALCPY